MYLREDPDHEELRERLTMSGEVVFSSALARVEIASALAGAVRTQRLAHAQGPMSRFDEDTDDAGWLSLVALRAEVILQTAFNLVSEHQIRTLDAIHVAVALEDVTPLVGDEPVVFVTRDTQQGEVARALGFVVE